MSAIIIMVIVIFTVGLDPLRQIVSALRPPCGAFVFIVQHIGANRCYLSNLLNACDSLSAAFARHDEAIASARFSP